MQKQLLTFFSDIERVDFLILLGRGGAAKINCPSSVSLAAQEAARIAQGAPPFNVFQVRALCNRYSSSFWRQFLEESRIRPLPRRRISCCVGGDKRCAECHFCQQPSCPCIGKFYCP